MGNGVTDEEIDGNAIIPFAYGQSLMSHEEYHRVHRECQGSFWNATQGKLDFASTFLHVTVMSGAWVAPLGGRQRCMLTACMAVICSCCW